VEAEGLWGRDGVVVKARVGVVGVVDRRGVWERFGRWVCGIWRRQRCIERIARIGFCGGIVRVWVVVCLFEVVMQLMSLQKIGHGPDVQHSILHAITTPTISPSSPSFQTMLQKTLGNICSSLINAELPPMRSYSAARPDFVPDWCDSASLPCAATGHGSFIMFSTLL
jgi:hypothetical protein